MKRSRELWIARPLASRAMRAAALGPFLSVAVLCGCEAPNGSVIQTGPGADADTAGVMAKVDDVKARLDLAFRKIDNTREITQTAARDLVSKEVQESREETLTAARDIARTTTTTGTTGQWLTAIVALFVSGASFSRYCEMKENIAEAVGPQIPDDVIRRRLKGAPVVHAAGAGNETG